MPLYEYLCKKCGHRFERIQKFSDPHVKKCPDCGGAVEQVITAPSVRFKGSGWYVNDYAKKSSESGSSSSSDSDSGSKAESKSDTKKDSSSSESKTESKKDDKPKSEKKSKKD